jgi:hypothetical protein
VVTKSTQLTDEDNTSDNRTEVLIESTYKQLVEHFKSGDKKPVDYFR